MSAKDDYVDDTGARAFAANRPDLAKLMRAAGLDVTYTRAFGTQLFTRELASADGSKRERAVLDCAAGAAGFFGHNHPALVGALSSALDAGRASSLPHAPRPRAGAAEAKLASLLDRAAPGKRWRAFLLDGPVFAGAMSADLGERKVDARHGIWTDADARDADMIILGDALGGGLASVGAVCVAGDSAVPLDDLEAHAPSELASALALAALELVEREDLVKLAHERGAHLVERLAEVRARHPRFVLDDVDGAGLARTLTISLGEVRKSTQSALLSSVGMALGAIIEGHLLHEHALRVTVRVDAHDTQAHITLHPPALIGDDDIERAGAALDSTLKLLDDGDALGIVAHLAGRPRMRRSTTHATTLTATTPVTPEPAAQVAYVAPLNPAELAQFDAALRPLDEDAREALLARLAPVMRAAVERTARMTSTRGAVDVRLVRAGAHATQLDAAAKLVDGADCIAFGAPLVDIARTHALASTAAATDGTALSLAVHIEAALAEARRRGVYRDDWRCAVVGAGAGELGAALARVLAPRLPQLLLVDAPGTEARLDDVAERVRATSPDALVASTTDLAELAECNIVFLASAGPAPMLTNDDVIVRDVRTSARVRLPPGNAALGDVVDAELAEAMLMALADWREPLGVPPTPERIARLVALAAEHGFVLDAD